MTRNISQSWLKTEISESIYQKLFFIFLLFFVSTFPFKSNINSAFLICLVVVFLFKNNLKNYLKLQIKNKKIIVFSAFYLLHLLSIFNSSNTTAAFKEVILKLPVLIFPLIIKSINWTNIKGVAVLCLFVAVIFFASLYSFVITYYQFFKSDLYNLDALLANDWAYFSFVLPQSINFHPPYFSLYLATGLIILYYLLSESYVRLGLLVKGAGFILILYFIFFLALLSSRTSFLATILVLSLWISLDIYQKGYFKYLLLFWLFIFGFLFTVYGSFPYLREKLNNNSGVSIRSQIWNGSYKVIQNNWLFGVGTGDIKPSLRNAYQNAGFTEGVTQTYNAHNQYLQTTVALGFIGLICLLLCFIVTGLDAICNQDKLTFAFLLIFGLCCLTESLLSRQHGVVLFCFFISFFPSISKRI